MDSRGAHAGHGHHHQKSHGLGAVFGSLYFKGFLWLFMGYLFYISTNLISQLTISSYGHVWDVKFEPLLVLMVASCIAGHVGRIRHDMHVILDTAAPFIFLPFFVMTGAALKLNQVAKAVPLMSLFVGLRYLSIFLACYGAGRFILKLPPHQYNNLWLTMTPQAGVALGLANEVKELSTDPWAAEFASTIVAAVVVNQIIGPVLCAMGLKRAGESEAGRGKQADGNCTPADDPYIDELESGVFPGAGGMLASMSDVKKFRHAVVIGDDETACELALQLALYSAKVSMPVLDDATAKRWEAIQKHIRATKGGVPTDLLADFRQETMKASIGGGNEGDDDDLASLTRSRAAMAQPTDLIVFTGPARRALDHINMLKVTSLGGRLPKLVAIMQDSALLEPMRQRGVLCIQPSIALSSVGLRMALMDEQTATQYSSESNVQEPGTDARCLLGKDTTSNIGADPASLGRVLTHRRRVLQRNVRFSRYMQLLNADPGLLFQQQPAGNVAPPRVSMFGRSSAVNGPEYFGGTGRGARGGNSNFVVPNDVYIMGGGTNGEGGFEEYPVDLADGQLRRSGRGYVAANLTPGAQGGSRRMGGAVRAKSGQRLQQVKRNPRF